MILSNSTYYVKRLPENPVNKYKWLYIDSSDGTLEFNNNKWEFALTFYLIQNLSLPLNTFSLSLSTQFTTVSDLDINVSPIQDIPDWVIQKDYCTCYKLSFEIDTNDSKFFDQILENYSISLRFNMDVDTDILNNAKLDLDQDELNDFVTEIYDQNKTLEFKYSNYEECTPSKNKFNIPKSYYLNSALGSYCEDDITYYELNNETEQIDEPIKKLVSINFNDEFTISAYKVKFIYQVNGKEQKEINYENTDPIYGNQPININYGFCTWFNESEGTIENQISGISGFYCPMKCSGYYEVQLKVYMNKTYKTIKFTNNFSFKGNSEYYKNKILVSNAFINSLEFFKEVSF